MEKRLSGRIAVVMPAFNEEGTIAGVIAGIREAVPASDIILIIDKSSDRTAEIASGLGAVVIRLPLKMGMGCAVQAGLKYAFRKGYEFVVRMDSDGQHMAADIPALLSPVLDKEADLTVGSRYLKGGEYDAPVIRRGVMVVMAGIVSFIYGRRFTDTTSGFKAMNRRALGFLSENYPTIGGTPTLILLKWAGLSVKEVPVRMKQRSSGDSYFTTARKIAYILRVCVELLALLVKRRGAQYKEVEV